MTSQTLQDKIKDLPDNPGVYIMRDLHDHILYIGKARNLKNRVRQYFHSPKNKTDKVLYMVSKIADFEYIITNNEIEALVLENNLIKKHKPPYNILLKDDKSYPFIRIAVKERFPRVEVVRKLKKDGAKYYGPYMQGISSKDIIDLIFTAFCLRSCALYMDKIPASHRPCLNYHIGRCMAPCSGKVSAEEYAAELSLATKFLAGNDKDIVKRLEEKMSSAAASEEFELAMNCRDQLKVLDKLVRKQVTALANDMDIDIFAIVSDDVNAVVAILFVRGGKLIGSDKQIVTDASLDLTATLSSYIFNYYQTTPTFPQAILINLDLDDNQELTEYFSNAAGFKINILKPIQGVRAQLLDMAENNAIDYLQKCIDIQERREKMTVGSLVQLKDKLGLIKMPYRMECFDISHVSGTDMVASMAVFKNGEPDRRMYRKFKIKTVEGNNDYECMKEVLIRRFREFANCRDLSFSIPPDLIVVDGGLGQLGYAEEAQKECGVDFEMIALAEREEDIYTRNRLKIVLNQRNQGLMTLQRLRDEAHRFAVTFHQQLRAKRQSASILQDIDGVGEARIKALFEHFKSISKIKLATISQLSEVKGISQSIAETIYNHFNIKSEN